MQKILKLTGASVLAIAVATNANAAGYTCEELVEYTSCNPGHYLTDSGSICPDGYKYYSGVCTADGYWWTTGRTAEWCVDDNEPDPDIVGMEYLGDTCLNIFYDDADAPDPDDDCSGHWCMSMSDHVAPSNITKICNECPIGSICSGATNAPTPCPAGSYCATAGLAQPTGKCAIGSFAAAGSFACSTCPSTGLTDIDGKTVVATTASTGAESISACIVGSDVWFKDIAGTYHYKSECQYGDVGNENYYSSIVINNESECTAIGGEWSEGADFICFAPDSFMPQTKDVCESVGLYWDDEHGYGCLPANAADDPGQCTSVLIYQGEPGVTCW